MSYNKNCVQLGNGHFGRGKVMIEAIAENIAEDREKHPSFAIGIYEAFGLIGNIYHALELAIVNKSEIEEIEKLLVLLMSVSARMLNREYVHEER